LYFVDVFTKDLLNRSNFVTLPILTKSDLENIEIIIPTLEEQVCIVENIISKTKEIDDLVQLEQKKIDLLKEYRQSLISEVVTGKIKVTTDE
jgi:type I restriction enzyme S subunit